MQSTSFAAAMLLCVSSVSAQTVADTPAPPPIIKQQFLTYLGIILCSLVLVLGLAWMVWLCWFKRSDYVMNLVANMKLQVPHPNRLMKTDLSLVEVTPDEDDMLTDTVGQGPMISKSYLAWRRSQLNTGTFLYLAVTGFTIALLVKGNTFDLDVQSDGISSDAYMLRDKARTQLLELIPLVRCIFALAFYSASAWSWVSYKQSIKLVAAGWFLVFFLPFLYFFVPWMDIVAPKEQVQDLCNYCLTTIGDLYAQLGYEMKKNGVKIDVGSVCSESIESMSNDVSLNIKLVDSSGALSNSQLVLTFTGLVLKYIVYLPFLFGALDALKSLSPGVLGLLLGLQGGLKMAKLMFPGVRITSWMLIILQASTIPVVMCVMALLLVVVGTIPVMFTAIFITLSMALFLVYGPELLAAVTKEQAETLMTKLGRIAIVLQFLGLVCLIIGIYMAEHLIALKSEGVQVVKDTLDPVFLARVILQMLAGMFISKVLFVDIVLHIIISTYIGVFEDPLEARREVFAKLNDFAILFPRYNAFRSVALKTDELEEGVEMKEKTVDYLSVNQECPDVPVAEGEPLNSSTPEVVVDKVDDEKKEEEKQEDEVAGDKEV